MIGSDVLAASAGLRLSGPAARVLQLLFNHPLASAADLGLLRGGQSPSGFYSALWELSSSGYAANALLGCTRPRCARWWLTAAGMDALGLSALSAGYEWRLCQLLPRLPMAEWFYQAAAAQTGLGPLEEFQWSSRAAWDAAARYRDGWAAFFWSGAMQVESRLSGQLAGLADDLSRHSMLSGGAFPSLMVFVASDRWQAEVVFRVVRRLALEDVVQVWCASDGSVRGRRWPGQGLGWVSQVPAFGGNGGWLWADRVASSLWADGSGVGFNRILGLAAEWPGMRSSLARRGFQEKGESKWALRLLRELTGRELVERSGERPYRYSLDRRGYYLLASRDRVANSQLPPGVRGHTGPVGRRLRAHEDGLMDLAGGFLEAGLPAAAGWRSWENLRRGSIMPDAMVYLPESPYGPGWHYVEYERYARGRYRAEKKLRGYASPRRREEWPVLVACWDAAAEGVFQGVAQEWGVSMLTTTMERLERYGPVGNESCWSMFGRPVYLGPGR